MNNNSEIFEVDGVKILGNFNNGSIIGIDNETYNYLINKADYSQEKKLMLEETLKELGFYEDSTNNFIDSAYIHVNDRCNLHCIGCYSFVEDRNKKDELEKEDIFIILDKLKAKGVKTIVISGGEPFLRDDIKEILKYAKETAKINCVTIITNGTLTMDRYRDSLKYIDELNISIDGYDENISFIRDEGTMALVIKFIKELPKDIKINLIATLHKKNVPYMHKYSDLAEKLGVRFSFSIFTVDSNNPLFDDYVLDSKELIEIEKKLMELNTNVIIQDTPIGTCSLNCRKKCESGNKLISIDARGDVYPCHMLHYDALKLGNALIDDFEKIVFTETNPLNKLDVDDFNDCKDCEYKYLCGGGCRGRSYLKNGTFDDKDSYCELSYNFHKDCINELKKRD